MPLPSYNYENPPDISQGPDALWTSQERDAWIKDYKHRFLIWNDGDKHRLNAALRTFERELWEFCYGRFGVPDYIQWLREVAFNVGGGTCELPRVRANRDHNSWRDYRDEIRSAFVGELHDEENYDEGGDPFKVAEYQAILWVLDLSPYRIWQVYQTCLDAAHDAVNDSLLEMAVKERGSGQDVQRATEKAMEKACKALWDEFEAPAKAAAQVDEEARGAFGIG